MKPETFKAIRKDLGLSQYKLASKMGLTKSTILRYEQGQVPISLIAAKMISLLSLTEKLKAYALQDKGLDTVDANLALGWQPDERDYGVAAHILRTLEVKSIRLLTNNPEKVKQLLAHGVKITERLPLIIPPTIHNQEYLETKAKRSGHMLGDLASIRDVERIKGLSEHPQEEE